MTDTSEARADLKELADSLGLDYSVVFVPFSASRYAVAKPKIKDLQVNWRATISKGRVGMSVDYSTGIGHLVRLTQVKRFGSGLSVDEFDEILQACEGVTKTRYRNPPTFCDILSGLAMDADVLDYGTFEEWASGLGYDPDSRKAEEIYRQCLAQSLKLWSMIGNDNLEKLRRIANEL